MSDRLPLSALLSQALVAFIIEFDNEFEHRMPHRTSDHGRTEGRDKVPWLVSMAMWSTCMRFVGEDGVTVGQLGNLARAGTNLAGLERWGYIDVTPDPADTRARPPRRDWVIRATPQGRRAQEVWRPLTGEIEQRWRDRFGARETGELTDALRAIDSELDPGLPDCLPVLGYGLFSRPLERTAPAPGTAEHTCLAALLSRILLAFAVEFEVDSDLSLAVSANVLRVLGEEAVPVRDIPVLGGVSKEGVSMAMGVLQKSHLAELGPNPDGTRGQAARLTARGQAAQKEYRELLGAIEQRWEGNFGPTAIGTLRRELGRLVGEPATSPLWRGLEPYPDGWRAKVRRPTALPHYPMVLHRGGFPDGS